MRTEASAHVLVRLKLPEITVLVLVVLLLGGCIPIPYWDRKSPEINGILLRDHVGVENAIVKLSLKETCGSPTYETKTDKDGIFHFEAIGRFHLVHWIGAHSANYWSVCFKLPDNSSGAWHGSFYGLAGLSHLSLSCEVQNDYLADLKCHALSDNPRLHDSSRDYGSGTSSK